MSDQPTASRFTSQNQTTNERLSTNTVGLVHLADFRKRRAEVLEQQVREAREAAHRTNASTSDRSQTATPNNAGDGNGGNNDKGGNNNSEGERLKKRKKRVKALVSFSGEEEEEGAGPVMKKADKEKKAKAEGAVETTTTTTGQGANDTPPAEATAETETSDKDTQKKQQDSQKQLTSKKISANTSVGILPRALTKAALRRDAAEREALRKEFLLLQTAVKATEIAIPFVFYDGTNIPGGIVKVKKGDFIWLFLDKSRKVGAELGVGGDKTANARRAWARVGVDDLMFVRGSIIIPHHYEFYFFIINKNVGPGNRLLFDYSAEAPLALPPSPTDARLSNPGDNSSRAAPTSNLHYLEGVNDDPTFTKVVDRRWYQRNKHIYPASMWQDFDPEKDYQTEIPRDTGGNAFFFTR
ncbi:XAP5, circadian clock regulator-domain-containing protein [Bombardia bombarda]|uniref:XAP5, circadian clock regulator-domain-containing protein n=1 Tax=Bombardia bombarda TaxID=252184 RepID=A0AA39WUF0_9PEZI|nr:XAP5, circadian clock regulator-domain-containing protein [Bombardia bombarda]